MKTNEDIINRINQLRTVQDVEEILSVIPMSGDPAGMLLALKDAVIKKTAEGHPLATQMAKGVYGH